MRSAYLSSLNENQRNDLMQKLFESQGKICFICEDVIDLNIHKNSLEIDHIEPLQSGGKDHPENFALAHSSCNESKQASDLRVARHLARFDKIKARAEKDGKISATLADLLAVSGGSKYSLSFTLDDEFVRYSFSDIGDNKIYNSLIYLDRLSNLQYFFAEIPIEYLYHDTNINPRGIGSNLRKLVEEFFKKRPQLHVTLGRINSDGADGSKVYVFDGQHKAAAQILLGVKKIPVRIFLNPDIDLLLTTNTNAGDTLRQVAFDISIKRRLGHTSYVDRIERYQKEHNLSPEDLSFSEQNLVNYFRGESREIKRFILDAVRDGVTNDPDNKLRQFIDFSGRAKERPLSYSAIDKTFYSFFISHATLPVPINYKADVGENPREIEKSQLVRLMNIIAEEIYIDRFDLEMGTSRIEYKLQQGENIPLPHLIAFRMSREEVLYNWLLYVKTIIQNFFVTTGKRIPEEKLFQERFPEQLWTNIRSFIISLRGLPIWINKELSATVFGGKQNYDYWEHIFRIGQTPSGQQVLPSGLNVIEMIRNQ